MSHSAERESSNTVVPFPQKDWISPLKNAGSIACAAEDMRTAIAGLETQLKLAKEIYAGLQEMLATNGSSSTMIRPGEYQGARLGIALENYLRARRGQKIPLKRALEDLTVGGVKVGQKHSLEHNVKIAIKQKSHIIGHDPDTWLIWLEEPGGDPPGN